MIKILAIARIISFIITVLTSIPLIVHYIQDTTPTRELVVDLHVIFGTIFILTAIPGMIINKIQEKKDNTKRKE